MMKYLMSFAKKNSMKSISLLASSDEGLRVYEKLGFEVVGECECFEYKNE